MAITGRSEFDRRLRAAGWDRVPVERATDAAGQHVVSRVKDSILTTVSEVLYRSDDYAVVVYGASAAARNCYYFTGVHLERRLGRWVVVLTGVAGEGCSPLEGRQ